MDTNSFFLDELNHINGLTMLSKRLEKSPSVFGVFNFIFKQDAHLSCGK